MTTLLQITDTHVPLDPEKRAHRNFLKQIEFVGHYKPNILVISGDLPAEDGSKEIYSLMAQALPLEQEVVIIPGNHDKPEMLYEVFGKERCKTPSFCHVVPLPDIDLVFVDSSSGTLSISQQQTLQGVRSESILFIHHPTKKLSNGFMDTNYPLQNLSEVDAAIRRSPIAQVFCGHFHCEHTVVEDYALHVTPSAAFRVGLNETEINVSYGGIPLREIIVDGTSVSTQVIDIEKTAGQ